MNSFKTYIDLLGSARVPTLVSVLRKSPALLNIIEAYAACLEARILEAHPSEIPDEDIGLLILQVWLLSPL